MQTGGVEEMYRELDKIAPHMKAFARLPATEYKTRDEKEEVMKKRDRNVLQYRMRVYIPYV